MSGVKDERMDFIAKQKTSNLPLQTATAPQSEHGVREALQKGQISKAKLK